MASRTVNIIVRYAVASVGLFMIAFAIALAIKSNLGTAPLSCMAYVLNLDMPGISVGTFTFLVNMLYILIQLAVLRRRFKAVHLMQVVASVLFGYMIDLSLWTLEWLEPAGFGIRLLLILAAAAVTALGTDIDDIVRRFDHIQIMLNNDDRVAVTGESPEYLSQLMHVRKMQSCCRFI